MHVFFTLSITIMSGRPASITWSVWMLKSHNILHDFHFPQLILVYTAVNLGQQVYISFKQYVKKLNNAQWRQFEKKELLFRKRIASRRINHSDFICNGNISLWIKVIKILIVRYILLPRKVPLYENP